MEKTNVAQPAYLAGSVFCVFILFTGLYDEFNGGAFLFLSLRA
jgi:hypothetical protein